MKHPNYPKATNQYLGTTSTSLPKSAKSNLQDELLRFRLHLAKVSERIDREKGKKVD